MFANLMTTIFGIAIVGVIFEMLLPDSANRKYLLGAMSIVFCYVFISGVLTEINVEKASFFGDEIAISEEYQTYVDKMRIAEQQKAIQKHLEENGFKNIVATIETEKQEQLLVVKKITLDCKNMVIMQTFLNINISEKLKQLTSQFCNLSAELVHIQNCKLNL